MKSPLIILILFLSLQGYGFSVSIGSQKQFQTDMQAELSGFAFMLGKNFGDFYWGLEVQTLKSQKTGSGVLSIEPSTDILMATGRYFSSSWNYLQPFLSGGIGFARTIVHTDFYGNPEFDSGQTSGRFYLGLGLQLSDRHGFAILEFREHFGIGESVNFSPAPSLSFEVGLRFN